MFELFLFINPLGLSCYQLEKRIRLLAAELKLEISVNYIPMVTMEAMKADMVKRNWNFNTSINLASYHDASVSAQSFYYAVQIAYGKKKARSFLFKLQESLSDGQRCYSPQLARELLKQLGTDLAEVEAAM
ncbi:DsbA family protein, partial [Lactobacillus nasalidis]|uniref:DsbA family protein n=2 Tax=Lactobacillus nasalidis TaxID=2797258 RepID=UPI001915C392